MNWMKKLRGMLTNELEEIAEKPELSAGDLETIDKLTDTIKNIDKIEMLNGEDYSYSSAGRTGKERGRKSERLTNKLEDLLEDCQTAKERSAICDCIDELKKL